MILLLVEGQVDMIDGGQQGVPSETLWLNLIDVKIRNTIVEQVF